MNEYFQYYTNAFKQYAVFTGRTTRPEYWYFFLFNVIISVILNLIDKHGFLSMICMMAVMLPAIGIGIRRLHDIGKSGWWLLISFIPIIGTIILLVFLATEGQTGKNQYGEDPRKTIQVGQKTE